MSMLEALSPTSLEFVRILEPRAILDEVGFSLETSSDRTTRHIRMGLRFAEERLVQSKFGSVRGLHYQLKRPRATLLRVVSGSIFFAAVDLRRSSPEFGLATCVEIAEESRQALWAPEGYACGYMSLYDDTKVLAKFSEYEEPALMRTLLWNDPDLRIPWPEIGRVLVTGCDTNGIRLRALETYD
jgi:dTDP-4-dehydrorhamnose 3,5-epimerase